MTTQPAPEKRRRSLARGFAIAFLILGWLLLVVSAAQSLLASIQLAALGLGALVSAVIALLWRNQP